MSKLRSIQKKREAEAFGFRLRAARYGFRRVPVFPTAADSFVPRDIRAMLRFRIVRDGIVAELFSADRPEQIGRFRSADNLAWWTEDGVALVLASPFLRSLRLVKEPLSVVLGEHGEFLREWEGR